MNNLFMILFFMILSHLYFCVYEKRRTSHRDPPSSFQYRNSRTSRYFFATPRAPSFSAMSLPWLSVFTAESMARILPFLPM